MLVSVCINTYNQANYIAKALEGALMQKTTFPFEILLGDDESNDGTTDICRKYAKKYPTKIRLFLRSRKDVLYVNGRATGRSNMVKLWNDSKGKYIALCNGDDYWIDPYKLQKQIDFLETNPEYGLVHTGYNILKNNTISKISALNPMPTGDIYNELLEMSFIGLLTVIFRKDIYNTITPVIEPIFNKTLMGDRILWLAMSRESKVHYLPDITAIYRRHDKSVSANTTIERAKSFFESSYYIRFYFIKKFGCKKETEKKVYLDYHKVLLEFSFKERGFLEAKKNYNAIKELQNPSLTDFLYFIGSRNNLNSIIAMRILQLLIISQKIKKRINRYFR
jgi:glycosyltransferase involved in cell wall biosynthesis